MDSLHDTLGNAIRKAREDKNLTQQQLAELVGVTLQHLQNVERGRRNPSVDVLFNIAIILNLSIDSVLADTYDSSQEMINKINIGLGNCSVHELNVVYATIEAIRKKDKDNLEDEYL